MCPTLGSEVTEELYEEVEESTEEKESKSAWVRQAVKERLEREQSDQTALQERTTRGIGILLLTGIPTVAGWSRDPLVAVSFVLFGTLLTVFEPETDAVISQLKDMLS